MSGSNPKTSRWLVGLGTVPFAIIHGVPARTSRAAVVDALEIAGHWSRWQARAEPHQVIRVWREGTGPFLPEPEKLADSISWASLAPVERALTVRVPGELYAAASRAARADGISLAEWVRSAVTVKLGAA